MLPSWLPSRFIVPIGKIMVPMGFHHLPNHIGDGSNMSNPLTAPDIEIARALIFIPTKMVLLATYG